MIHTVWNTMISPALLAVQDSGSDEAAKKEAALGILAALGMVACCGAAAGLAVQAVICFFIFKAQKKVPQQHQQMSPGMVWLLMIPFFNLVWNFFVFSRVPLSLQAALNANGKNVGDCGKKWGLVYSIIAVCCLVTGVIPFLGLGVAVVGVVFCILSIVGMHGAAKELS